MQKNLKPIPATNEDIDRLRDTVDRWRVQLQAKVDEHHKALYGNGQPGMDENIRNIQKDLNEDKEQRKFLYHSTVGAAIATALMLLVNGAIYFAKILPILEKLKP